MIRFLTGPAAGEVLALRRAPLFLRVVQGPKGDWDALDQLEDRPSADERIFVYRRFGEPGRVHIKMSGKHRGGSGWYAVAEYVQVEGPGEAVVRDRAAWRAWTYQARAANREGSATP